MLQSADRWLLDAIYAGGLSAAWLGAALFLTFLGSGWMMFGLLPFFFVQRLRFRATALLVTLAVTSGVVASAKMLVGRVRPYQALGLAHGVSYELPTDPSFPSGHAAGSFAFAAFVAASSRRAGLVLAGIATLIALSRVALAVHYPSDVAAGALLGDAIGSLAARLAAKHGESATPDVGSAKGVLPIERQPPSV
jgi:undecaprenyl-diphosphatase